MRITVIGGGISGLACGHGLTRELPDAEIEVLESSGRPGGVMGTARIGEFVFDDGPGGWLDRDDSTQRLLEDVGLSGSVISGNTENRRRFVWKDGKLRRFPSDLRSFATTDLLSVSTKLRLLAEPWFPWRDGDEDRDVASLFSERLGGDAMRSLIDPVLAGIYAGRPEDLSVRATLPAIARLSEARRSFIKQALASRRSGAGVGGGYASLRDGMGSLPDAIAADLGERFLPNSPVSAIERTSRGWAVTVAGERPREITSDVVVLAVPARVGQRLLAPVEPEIERFFASVPTAPVAVVGLGYRQEGTPELKGYGHLIPSTEPGPVLGVLWSSSIFVGRSEGGAVLRVILGGWRDPEIHLRSEEELVDIARAEVEKSLGFERSPDEVSVARHPDGLPQYRVGHLERVAELQRVQQGHPGLYVTGNAVHGIGVNACTAAAASVVREVGVYCRSLA